jgi:DNA-binding NtrC family response regulator
MRQILGMLATRWGYEHRTASDGAEALSALQDFPAEIVLSDVKMPGVDGEALLRDIRARQSNIVVVMMTAFATVKSAVEAMKIGAFDYIMKPFENDELRLTLERAGEFTRLKQDNAFMRRELGEKYRLDRIIGESTPIRDVMTLIERVAPSRATVLVTGESGTGKELVAKAIHFNSTRSTGPFVRVNCAALAETLLESELFGHEKGAFTGAMRTHRGKFEEADGGTIFLDEIGETSNNFQAKLLRVLQEGVITRVGSNAQIEVDVRVVAATNRNLPQRVREGHFREDLYFRLNVLPIHLPSLRERPTDIPLLAEHFTKRFCEENSLPLKTLSEDARQAMMGAPWQGNVRELENTIERAVILSRDPVIHADDLWLPGHPKPVLASAAAPRPADASIHLSPQTLNRPLAEFLDEMTRLRILTALDSCSWRKQEAADLLAIDRATLYRQMKKFRLEEASASGTPA